MAAEKNTEAKKNSNVCLWKIYARIKNLPPRSGSVWMEKMKICVRFENVPCRLTRIHFSHTEKKLIWASVNATWELKRIFPPALTQIPLALWCICVRRKALRTKKNPFSRIQIISFPSRRFPTPAPDGFEIFQPSVNNFFCSEKGKHREFFFHSEPDSFSYLRFDCNTNQFHIQFKVVQLFSYPLFRFSKVSGEAISFKLCPQFVSSSYRGKSLFLLLIVGVN